MKALLTIMLCLLLTGCATSTKINQLSLGMNKLEVIKVMGQPVSTSASQGTEYLNYKLSETDDDAFMGVSTPYAVCLKDGKVVSYGRHGDFENVQQQPTEVIKIIREEAKNSQ
jgi:outer membrane protein assembly factor BamE (lipoprotein component of BamABCDE complex)